MFEKIPVKEFKDRTGNTPNFASEAEVVVSLRDLVPGSITNVHVMSLAYLLNLLRNVTLEGDPDHKPYANAEIELARIDPNSLGVGQTFVQRGKYQGLIETFNRVVDEAFCVTRGFAKCNALIMFGKTSQGEKAVAHYIPPIVEMSSSGMFLLDGIHRNYPTKSIGTTIESVCIRNVSTPLPCDVKSWTTIRVVDEKPPREERFYNLKPNLFRNLKRVGVDG